MKKNILIVTLLMLVFFINLNNVFAKETYFVNDNGVSFSKEEYDFLTQLFWDGCQKLFSNSDYDHFINSDIMNGELNVKINNVIMPMSTLHETNSKIFKIATSCNSNCLVSVTLTWKVYPNIRSYDVMGAYLENTTLLNSPITTITNSVETYIQKFNNGFGVSLKLPTGKTDIIVNQVFKVSKGGHVYASYQHAKNSISLDNSKKYTLSKQGYGGVFKFSGTAVNVYDQMRGIDIAV